jgi:hypothetical protein
VTRTSPYRSLMSERPDIERVLAILGGFRLGIQGSEHQDRAAVLVCVLLLEQTLEDAIWYRAAAEQAKGRDLPRWPASWRLPLPRRPIEPGTRFVADSLLEGAGFEPSVPRLTATAFPSLLDRRGTRPGVAHTAECLIAEGRLPAVRR